jgi:hypothetical protein
MAHHMQQQHRVSSTSVEEALLAVLRASVQLVPHPCPRDPPCSTTLLPPPLLYWQPRLRHSRLRWATWVDRRRSMAPAAARLALQPSAVLPA